MAEYHVLSVADYKVKLKRAGIKKWLRSKEAQDAIMTHANRVAGRAEMFAPKKPKNLKGSIIVERGARAGKNRTRVFVIANTKSAARTTARDNWMQRAVDSSRSARR